MAQLTKAHVATDVAAYGQFAYKIKWKLTAPLQVDAVIVQEIKVSYALKDAQDAPIQNISDYTGADCMWLSHLHYWEAWFIKAGEDRPAYATAEPKIPSFGAQTSFAMVDDSYSAGEIWNKKVNPPIKGITKGWVRHEGTATLYKADELSRIDANWINKFTQYTLAGAATPAGLLPYSDADPNYSVTSVNALEGNPVPDHMVAYWNSCMQRPESRLTKVEVDVPYSNQQLEAKVNNLAVVAAQAAADRAARLAQRQAAASAAAQQIRSAGAMTRGLKRKVDMVNNASSSMYAAKRSKAP